VSNADWTPPFGIVRPDKVWLSSEWNDSDWLADASQANRYYLRSEFNEAKRRAARWMPKMVPTDWHLLPVRRPYPLAKRPQYRGRRHETA
jgi:hypothetical protein